jgi:hypothetical protein
MPIPKRPRSSSAAKPASFGAADGKSRPADLEEEIRARAYQLYVERGFQDGFAQDDWLRAEAEVTSQNPRRSI